MLNKFKHARHITKKLYVFDVSLGTIGCIDSQLLQEVEKYKEFEKLFKEKEQTWMREYTELQEQQNSEMQLLKTDYERTLRGKYHCSTI